MISLAKLFLIVAAFCVGAGGVYYLFASGTVAELDEFLFGFSGGVFTVACIVFIVYQMKKLSKR